MLDVNDRQAPGTESGKELSGFRAGLGAADQFHGSAGEVIVLDVYDQEGLGHGNLRGWEDGLLMSLPVWE